MPLRKRSKKAVADENARVKAGLEAMALDPGERSKRIRALIAVEAEAFLERRRATINRLRLEEFNPNILLLRLVRSVHRLDTVDSVVSYLVDGRLHAGEETAYGWLVDLFLPNLFGASTPPEREDEYRWEGYKEIDKEVLRPNPGTGRRQRHMISLKSGPWTINDTMAREMHENVEGLQKYGVEPIVYGVTYGRREQLSNKPAIVKGDFPDEKVAILVGREFWDWLAQYENAHLDILNGIADGEAAFQQRHQGNSLSDLVAAKKKELTVEFIKEFHIDPARDLWEQLAKEAF